MLWDIKLDKKITLEPAFVIHIRAFKETSLMVELFTRSKGKISVIAKGARRPKSNLKAIKTPSSLFSVTCVGKSELKTLINCEIKEYFDPSSNSFNCLVYLNELLVKLLEKEDAHQEVFDQYINVCRSFRESCKTELEVNLRLFEFILLKEIGYGVDLKNEANSEKKINKDFLYTFDPFSGFLPYSESTFNNDEKLYKGKDILNFSEGDLTNSDTRIAAKQIMRKAMDFHLGNKNIKIREYLSYKGDNR